MGLIPGGSDCHTIGALLPRTSPLAPCVIQSLIRPSSSLVSGFALQQKPVGATIVQEVCRDFDFRAALESRYVPSVPASALVGPRPSSPSPIGTGPATEPRAADDGAAAPVAVRSDSHPGEGAMFSSFTRRRRFSFF